MSDLDGTILFRVHAHIMAPNTIPFSFPPLFLPESLLLLSPLFPTIDPPKEEEEAKEENRATKKKKKKTEQ
jgi:hypothetical protein